MTQQLETQLALTINGDRVRLKDTPLTTTLLDFLRLTGRVGTKEGCGDGDCGACTVAIVGTGPDGKPHYQAVNSCLIPIGSVVGRDIITVEGVANGKLHPVQEAMVKLGGSQCGYCTPGFIMSMFAAYYDGKLDDVSVEGNLCRCTGYLPIRRAAQAAAAETPCDHFSEHLSEADSELMPFSFAGDTQFYRPTRLQEVLELLRDHSNATLVAGATDLGLELQRREFPVMVSLEAVAELQTLVQTDEFVEIGAAVPLTHIETQLHGIFPCMDEMIHWFAARQVRNRATLGGNIGTASPIGDLPPVLLALGAELKLVSLAGERWLPLSQFFKGYRQTDLQPGEVIATVKISRGITPGATQRISQSYKIGKRGTDDISIVAAAYVVDLDSDKQVVQARLGYGGVAATPARAAAVEEFLVGKPWNADTVQQAKPVLYNAFTPLTDLRGSAEYRKMLVANLFEKFFVEFAAEAGVEE